jgi:hypothetical protein
MVVAAFLLAYHLIQLVDGRLGDFHNYSWVPVVLVPVWLFLMAYTGLYASMRTKVFSRVVGNLVKVHTIGSIITASCVYLIDPKGFSMLLLGCSILILTRKYSNKSFGVLSIKQQAETLLSC